MSTSRAENVQLVTRPSAGAAWDDEDAKISSLISDRLFQVQVDAHGVLRCLGRDREEVGEVAFADVVAEARGSAALLRAQARNEAFAGLAALVSCTLQRLAAALAMRPARSPRLSGRHPSRQGL